MNAETINFNQLFVEFLEKMGVEHAFGIVGGPIASLSVALSQSKIRVSHFKHETSAAYAALEASLVSQKPVVVFVTTGPGITNALTGVLSAAAEGAKLIFITGWSSPQERGRFVSQDTSSHSFAKTLFSDSSTFDFSQVIEHEGEIELAFLRIAQGCQRPSGFVAHLAIPAWFQRAKVRSIPGLLPAHQFFPATCSREVAEACVDILSDSRFGVWVGFGARDAWQEVRTLLEVTGAIAMFTPRAKGIVPHNHPQLAGMTGLGGEDEVETYLSQEPVDHILVLGSHLGEVTSFWSEGLTPRQSFIHVDIDPKAFGAAYPKVKTVGVQSEIRAFLLAFLEAWRARGLQKRHGQARLPRRASEPYYGELLDGPVRPSVLMRSVQSEIVEKSDAIIAVDVGNAFAFSNRHLHFAKPHRYRVHFNFGSMGSACAGVLGTAFATGKKSVAITGDGALLMFNEINTAARYNLPCLWIVLNDARYGMVAQGIDALYGTFADQDFPQCNFAQLARDMGADGIRVTTEKELDAALNHAMHVTGPFVVDVLIDRTERAPFGKRISSLLRQAGEEG